MGCEFTMNERVENILASVEKLNELMFCASTDSKEIYRVAIQKLLDVLVEFLAKEEAGE